MDVIDVMAESKKVCDYLDMPLQHASDSILKSMRRGITQEKTESLLADIRARVPGIAIRTTLIVGFPGETEDDHANLLDWIGRMKFERLGCFTYSHEENTHAYNLEDDVPEEVKKKRVDEVMELQAGISEELNLRHIGKVFKVMIDRCEGGFWLGRTEYDSPDVDNEVRIPVADDLHLRVGDFVKVKITGATAFDLDGELA
jgi:ribosomal protein S12 methylthiotransferase